MSVPACLRLDELLAGRDADRLDPADELLLRRHLSECAECAARAVRHDPVLLFARGSGPEALSPDARERLVADVLASVSAVRAARRFGRFRAGAGLRLAASLLLAVSVAGAWLTFRSAGPAPVSLASPGTRASEPRRAPVEPLPVVEDLAAVDAVVYQFPATEPGEATVVFVVDRNADI